MSFFHLDVVNLAQSSFEKEVSMLANHQSKPRIRFLIPVIICVSLILAGCGVKAVPDSPGDGDMSDPPPPGDSPPVALACPKDSTEFTLFISHTWDFSPNRDTEMMKVNGQTEPSSPCPITIAGGTVIMEACQVPFTSTGFIKTNDGMCDITASGSALVTLDDAYCEDAKVTLSIVENLDTDAPYSGAMNCPDVSQPYIPFYPFSHTTRTFHIQVGGTTQTEDMDPDLSNQFKYQKEWTLYSVNLLSPNAGD
jgi:hypothetical protein